MPVVGGYWAARGRVAKRRRGRIHRNIGWNGLSVPDRTLVPDDRARGSARCEQFTTDYECAAHEGHDLLQGDTESVRGVFLMSRLEVSANGNEISAGPGEFEEIVD